GLRPQQTFHSSDIKSPLFQVNTFKPHAVDGNPYIFMTPSVKDQSSGVQIFSRKDLSLVYAQYGWKSTNNFRPQEFNGKQYLSFWQGEPATGHGLGQGILLDEHYDVAYNISINAFNSRADSHEFQLTHDGGAMFSVYETVRNWDMRPVGGPEDGVLQDSAFEEVDVVTGETRFAWRASDWFSIEDTTVGYNDVEDYGHPTHDDGWDFFHINSLEKTRDGNYLVSGRRCKVLTLINGTSGVPIWIIGGKRNQYADLSDGMATNFAYQHHARFDNDDETEIVMFDNAQLANTQPSPGCQAECSRGLHIRMNHENKTAEVVRSYWHPKSVQARAEGGVDRQPNGNLLVGWGKVPGFTEFSREGEVLLDVQTGPWTADGNAHVYRIYSRDWEAYPPWDPEVALFESNLYVSWNGATELAYWAM
ncbi:ASST-domain-containing protein, partial [Emericellopsis atlantica]